MFDRSAEQIATVGDVLYYFGEPGMQEHESSKYLKETLEHAAFKVELGGAGMPTSDLGFGKSSDRDRDPRWTLFRKARNSRQHPAQTAGRGRARPHGRA